MNDELEHYLRLAEAVIFASASPVSVTALSHALPVGADPEMILPLLRQRYAGRGIELHEIAGGWQFRTAPDLANALRRVVEVPRRLPRVAMETLAVIAYHQPVTRGEVEEIRGATLSQSTLDTLLEAGLITPRGRKEVPGRPSLWGTTARFLEQFGLTSLTDLPKREELLTDGAGQERVSPRPGIFTDTDSEAVPEDEETPVEIMPAEIRAEG
ncbi:Segregation and condensation protein ScpB [Granulibacter bethesdensis]|uniref:Segregation and condensation protein ScpB n=1 Tax=Granulibacter bethesdensis TaxID=364410 RepID=A0AAC9KC03_9PROT|nr:SMC-Scp complex subunit ScpB [Granulibacter bethesdensis]APH54553.1 Segregation and condensation protein ScpB [Granulibacter bethesdensis]APH62139.1 Segregation and condensation protein ScpB [Granulibacter bethesdensis]